MKNSLLLSFALLVCAPAIAQTQLVDNEILSVTKQAFQEDSNDEFLFFAKSDLIAFRQAGKKDTYTYRFYDNELDEIKSITCPESDLLPDEMTLMTAFNIKDRIVGFAYHTDAKMKKNTVYMLTWDEKSYRFSDDMIIVFEFTGDQFSKEIGQSYIGMMVSENASKILICAKDLTSKVPLRFMMKIYSDDLQELEDYTLEFDNNGPFLPYSSKWNDVANLDYSFNKTMNTPFHIDDNGLIVARGTNLEDTYFSCAIQNGRASYAPAPDDKEYLQNTIKFFQPDGSSAFWVGYHRVNEANNKCEFVFGKFGPQGMEKPTVIDWDNEVLREFKNLGDYEYKKDIGDQEFLRIYGPDLIYSSLNDNQELTLGFEYHQVNYGDQTTYHTLGVLLTKTDLKTDRYQSCAVKKEARSMISSYHRSYLFEKNGLLHVVFNDHPRDFEPEWDGKVAGKFGSPKGNCPVALVSVDLDVMKVGPRVLLWYTEANDEIGLGPKYNPLLPLNDGSFAAYTDSSKRGRNILKFSLK
jgi:hypothetical protein